MEVNMSRAFKDFKRMSQRKQWDFMNDAVYLGRMEILSTEHESMRQVIRPASLACEHDGYEHFKMMCKKYPSSLMEHLFDICDGGWEL
jgi:hypothetical protein